MSTLNVSMPESMREYVEAQAASGHYTASEYVRQLIREDQKKTTEQNRKLLWDYLSLSARQLDEGDVADVTLKGLLEKGRKRRKSEKS